MLINKRPQSAIKYEPSGYKRPQSNECHIYVPGADQTELAETKIDSIIQSKHLVQNRMSRPASALSLRQKINSTSILHNDTRTTPRYMKRDKEDLYQNVLQLQTKLNDYLNENTKLKTQIQQMEKEICHLTEMLKNVDLFVNKRNNYISAFELKKSIQDLKAQLKQKEDEVKSAKYNTKSSKLEEMRVELRESHMECIRLRTLVDQNQRTVALMQYNTDHTLIEEKVYIQGQMLNNLKTENDQLIGMLKIEEEETNYYKNLLSDTLKTVRKYEETIDDLHKNLKGKNGFMDQLALKIEALRGQNVVLSDKVIKAEDFKMEIRKLKQIIQELEKQLLEANGQNDYLNGMVHELKIKNAEKSVYETKEKKFLQDQIQKIQQQYDLLDERYKNLLSVQLQNRQTLVSFQMMKQQTTRNDFKIDMRNDSLQQAYIPKKLRVVKTQDVTSIGLELNYRFKLKKIILSDVIEQYLFDDHNKKEGSITIRELHDRFQQEPFLLLDQDKSLLLARYLIEDNSADFIEFNIDQGETLARVSSIFSKLIGKYVLFTFDEERKVKEEIIPIILKYKQSLKLHFDSLSSMNGELTRQQLLDTFTFMDIDFNNQQLEFFFLKLFAISNKIDQFPYSKIFEIFQPSVVVQNQHQLHREKTTKRKPQDKLFQTKSFYKRQDSQQVPPQQ